MAIGSRVSGEFKSASNLFAKVNGGWKKADFGYIKVNGVWKQFWAAEVIDSFNRADTQTGLGTATSGQAWTIARSQWQINANNARTTGTKTDYPLAFIDSGFSDFNLEANDLTPGTGVAIRVTDANNWWAVMPYYTQTATPFSYCVRGRNESYCISLCTEPSGYTLRCDPPNQEFTEPIYDFICYDGYYANDEFVCVARDIRTVVQRVCQPDTTETYNCCIRYCAGRCCDRDICTRTVKGSCVNVPVEVDYGCLEYDLVPGEFYCTDERYELVGSSTGCYPDGYTNVELYDCCQSGTQFICEEVATGVNYTNYYYLRVVKMENGVFSVVSDLEVPERWTGLKVTGSAANLTVTAFKDNAYTQPVGTRTLTNFTTAATGFGVAAIPSLFEDGRTIGSLTVKPLGQ
jgi:hypothetical protein